MDHLELNLDALEDPDDEIMDSGMKNESKADIAQDQGMLSPIVTTDAKHEACCDAFNDEVKNGTRNEEASDDEPKEEIMIQRNNFYDAVIRLRSHGIINAWNEDYSPHAAAKEDGNGPSREALRAPPHDEKGEGKEGVFKEGGPKDEDEKNGRGGSEAPVGPLKENLLDGLNKNRCSLQHGAKDDDDRHRQVGQDASKDDAPTRENELHVLEETASEMSWMVVDDGADAPMDQVGDLKSYNVVSPLYSVTAARNSGLLCNAEHPKHTPEAEESECGLGSGCENENNSLSCGSSMVFVPPKELEGDVPMSVKEVIGPSNVGDEAANLFQGCWMDSLNNAVWVDHHLLARFRRLRRHSILTLKIRFKEAHQAWFCGNGTLISCSSGALAFETKDGRKSYWRRPSPEEHDKFFWNLDGSDKWFFPQKEQECCASSGDVTTHLPELSLRSADVTIGKRRRGITYY